MSKIDVEKLYLAVDKGREGKNIGVSTGLQRLDNWIGAIQKKTYYLIFGTSGAGNIGFIKNICYIYIRF